MIREDRFALNLRGVVFRLVLGLFVLAIVIPAAMSGLEPMWPVALIAIVVVAFGILAARRPRLRAWLRHR